MCDKCLVRSKLIEKHNKSVREGITNLELVNRFARACSNNNEFDNRTEVEKLKTELLKRMDNV